MAEKRPQPGDDRDSVDHIVDQWHATRPGVDVSPIEVIGRISRLSRLVDKRLGENFGRFGLQDWMYDVLGTLRRQGEPYALTAGDLVRRTMVTTGAITHRIDRLEDQGLVERTGTDDRRKVVVRLTPRGLQLVDEVLPAHLDTEREILAALSERERRALAALLRTTLLAMGDSAPPDDRSSDADGNRSSGDG
jgi:DNA-binding MarR family transcriptional regulator